MKKEEANINKRKIRNTKIIRNIKEIITLKEKEKEVVPENYLKTNIMMIILKIIIVQIIPEDLIVILTPTQIHILILKEKLKKEESIPEKEIKKTVF
jgi:hypothetical protein